MNLIDNFFICIETYDYNVWTCNGKQFYIFIFIALCLLIFMYYKFIINHIKEVKA